MPLSITGVIAIIGWVTLAAFAFAKLKLGRAATFSLVTAVLFWPVFHIHISHVSHFDRTNLSSLFVLGFCLFYGRREISRFRPGWIDLPMFLWISSPLLSSLSNDLGIRDGLFEVVHRFFGWGTAYIIGRVFFETRPKAMTLIWGIVFGGMAYVPFCLYEIRMSPQLHRMVYGYMQHDFGQTFRFGGWRPMVFMDQGLSLGLWMALSSLAGLWVLRTQFIDKPASPWLKLGVVFVIVTTILGKSVGSLVLLTLGLFLVLSKNRILSRMFLLILFSIPVIFISGRISGIFDGQGLVNFVGSYLSVERAQSIWYRTYNELLLIERVMQQPILGWGGHGRGFVYTEFSNRLFTVTDSFWIIALSANGIWGLTWAYTALTLPIILFFNLLNESIRKVDPSDPMIYLTTLFSLFALDTIFNNLPNVVYFTALGSATSLIASRMGVGVRKRKLKELNIDFDLLNPGELRKRETV